MTVRARLNAKGALAAPGAAQIFGPNVTLNAPDGFELDFSGFVGSDEAQFSVSASDGLTVEDLGRVGDVWTLILSGAGAASLSISTASGKAWSGRVNVR